MSILAKHVPLVKALSDDELTTLTDHPDSMHAVRRERALLSASARTPPRNCHRFAIWEIDNQGWRAAAIELYYIADPQRRLTLVYELIARSDQP